MLRIPVLKFKDPPLSTYSCISRDFKSQVNLLESQDFEHISQDFRITKRFTVF